MRFHTCRITESQFYQVVCTYYSDPHKPSVSLVNAICYPETVKFVAKAIHTPCGEIVIKYLAVL